MHETKFGLAAGAHARSGDGFWRPDFTIRDETDLAAAMGAAPATSARRRDLRNALVVALLLSAWIDPDRWIAYARDRNAYTAWKGYFGPMASYELMLWAVQSLETVGLIEHRKTRPGPAKRFRSTLRATDELIAASPLTHVNQLRRVIWEPIRLKDFDRKLTRYAETLQTRSWRADAQEQNEALLGLRLGFTLPEWEEDGHGIFRQKRRVLNPARNQTYRVFNFDWCYGGRWYGPWWQGLNSTERAEIRINDQSVCEVDYRYLHPTLLAALDGRNLGSEDPYAIDGISRNDVKTAFNTLINADTEMSAVLSLQNTLSPTQSYSPRQQALHVVQAVKARHTDFADAFGTGRGRQLQCVDGHMCSEVQRIMRRAGHPVLSVHDSFIVEASQKDLLERVMDDVLQRAQRRLANGTWVS